MNVLIVGSGAGSWQMRGVQLGEAMGAKLSTSPSAAEFRWADVVVLVKRAAFQWAPYVHAHHKPLVWDALDCWAQPMQNGLNELQARHWLADMIRMIRPTLTIGATQAMTHAVEGVYLPHHPWPGLTPAPVRERVGVVAYQGAEHYLGRWYLAILRECQARGWVFLINPDDLRDADLLVAFRDEAWDGWMCRQWKSGVKYVNAMAAGRPILTQPSAAYDDLHPHGSLVERPMDLSAAFDVWSDPARRREVAAHCQEHPPATVETIAQTYLETLQTRVLSCV